MVVRSEVSPLRADKGNKCAFDFAKDSENQRAAAIAIIPGCERIHGLQKDAEILLRFCGGKGRMAGLAQFVA